MYTSAFTTKEFPANRGVKLSYQNGSVLLSAGEVLVLGLGAVWLVFVQNSSFAPLLLLCLCVKGDTPEESFGGRRKVPTGL